MADFVEALSSPSSAAAASCYSPFTAPNEFGTNETILTAVSTFTYANALPENAAFFTTKSASGKPTAPETMPAFKRAETTGATALPVNVCEMMIVSALI